MRRTGRVLSVTSSALGVLALGFLVAIAANSVPGRGEEEPFLDVAWRPGVDVTTVVTWLVLIAAVIGAIVIGLSARETGIPREHKRRGLLVLLLGILVFAVIARYVRSITGILLGETSEVIGEVGDQPIRDSSGNGAWLLSLLVAGVIAAALARVGLSIRSGAPPFQDLAEKDDRPPIQPADPAMPPQIHGADPRGRILSAYGGFEEDAGVSGVPRGQAETAARHAGRVGAAFDLGGEDLTVLSDRHADVRFGPGDPSDVDADEAELAAARLRTGMSR